LVALAKLIDLEVASAATAEQLRTWARLAAEESLHHQMSTAYYKILEYAPTDREALVRLGKLAFAEGRYKPARELLDRAVAAGERDWESYWLMGDLLTREKRPAEARRSYNEALRLLAVERNRPFPVRAAEALLLHKSRREDEARAAFEKLLAERPDDANLKADYAAVLTEGGLYDRAEQILARH